jgi:predicted MFS family arabinose efflux permease
MLFALDAFGGGFVVNSFMSFWYVKNWQLQESTIGGVLMLCGFMSAWGGIVAAQIVRLIGPMPTIFVTHIPSNLLTMIIPFIPNQNLSIAALVFRYFTSKMNVSARQTYINTLVKSS